MATVVAVRHNPRLAACSARSVATGNLKPTDFVALRRKMLEALNVLLAAPDFVLLCYHPCLVVRLVDTMDGGQGHESERNYSVQISVIRDHLPGFIL
jgi:hypothetical protein